MSVELDGHTAIFSAHEIQENQMRLRGFVESRKSLLSAQDSDTLLISSSPKILRTIGSMYFFQSNLY